MNQEKPAADSGEVAAESNRKMKKKEKEKRKKDGSLSPSRSSARSGGLLQVQVVMACNRNLPTLFLSPDNHNNGNWKKNVQQVQGFLVLDYLMNPFDAGTTGLGYFAECRRHSAKPAIHGCHQICFLPSAMPKVLGKSWFCRVPRFCRVFHPVHSANMSFIECPCQCPRQTPLHSAYSRFPLVSSIREDKY